MEEIVSEKEAYILGLKKQLHDLEVNYKHQSCLLENIRNEKNVYFQDLKQARVRNISKVVQSYFDT